MTVLIIDDDPLVRVSLRTIVGADKEIQVCGMGASAAEAVDLYEQTGPDVLLMDIRMGKETGLSAAETIIGRHPSARVLFLTTFEDDDYILEALRIGARGYLLKQNYESIVPSLKAVFAGQAVMGQNIMAKLPGCLSRSRPDFSRYGLTEKESALLELVAEGLSNREIASRLFLSEGTVRNGVSTLLEKFGLHGRTQLAVFYYREHKKK